MFRINNNICILRIYYYIYCKDCKGRVLPYHFYHNCYSTLFSKMTQFCLNKSYSPHYVINLASHNFEC